MEYFFLGSPAKCSKLRRNVLFGHVDEVFHVIYLNTAVLHLDSKPFIFIPMSISCHALDMLLVWAGLV